MIKLLYTFILNGEQLGGVSKMEKRNKTFDLTLGAMFVALTAIGANMTSIAPFLVIGGVPITLQTFFAVVLRVSFVYFS